MPKPRSRSEWLEKVDGLAVADRELEPLPAEGAPLAGWLQERQDLARTFLEAMWPALADPVLVAASARATLAAGVPVVVTDEDLPRRVAAVQQLMDLFLDGAKVAPPRPEPPVVEVPPPAAPEPEPEPEPEPPTLVEPPPPPEPPEPAPAAPPPRPRAQRLPPLPPGDWQPLDAAAEALGIPASELENLRQCGALAGSWIERGARRRVLFEVEAVMDALTAPETLPVADVRDGDEPEPEGLGELLAEVWAMATEPAAPEPPAAPRTAEPCRRPCEQCGAEFLSLAGGKFCSGKCKTAAWRRGNPGPRVPIPARECEQCGVTFTPGKANGRFCSAKCRSEYHNAAKRAARMQSAPV